MALRPGWSLALLAFLALAPAATAGTAAAPEVLDADGDGTLCTPQGCSPSLDALDLARAWVDLPNADQVAFHLRVNQTPPSSGAGGGATLPPGCAGLQGRVAYRLHFATQDPLGAPRFPAEPGGAEVTALYLQAARPCDTLGASHPLGWEFTLAYTYEQTAGTAVVAAPVDGLVAGNDITWVVERSAVGVHLPRGAAKDYRVADLVATSALELTAGILSGGVLASDRAPDAGFGLPFVLGVEPPVAPPVYANVAAPALDVVARFATPSNQTYVYNWTNAAARVDLAFGAAVRGGSAHVLVRDHADAVMLDRTFPGHENGSFALADVRQGPWQATIAYSNFTGDLHLSIGPPPPPPAPGSTTTSAQPPRGSTTAPAGEAPGPASTTTSGSRFGNAAGTTTTVTLPPSKGLPGPGLALGVLAVAAVAMARRRLAA